MKNIITGFLAVLTLLLMVAAVAAPIFLSIYNHNNYYLWTYIILFIPIFYFIGDDINNPKKKGKRK